MKQANTASFVCHSFKVIWMSNLYDWRYGDVCCMFQAYFARHFTADDSINLLRFENTQTMNTDRKCIQKMACDDFPPTSSHFSIAFCTFDYFLHCFWYLLISSSFIATILAFSICVVVVLAAAISSLYFTLDQAIAAVCFNQFVKLASIAQTLRCKFANPF